MKLSTALLLIIAASGAAVEVAFYAETGNTVTLGFAVFLGLMFVVNLTVYIVRGE